VVSFILKTNENPPRSQQKCELHPLIHTLLEFDLAQDFGGCKDRLLRDSDATMIMQP